MKGLVGLLAGIVAGALAMTAVGYVGTSLYPLHVPADPAQRVPQQRPLVPPDRRPDPIRVSRVATGHLSPL